MQPMMDAFKHYDTPEFRRETAQLLVEYGAVFGDAEALMRAKAEAFCQMLRTIIDEVPIVKYTALLPEDLNPKQVELIVAAIEQATVQGVLLVLTHALECIIKAMYDLCTSRLAVRPNA